MQGLIGRESELAAIGAALRRPDLAAVLITGDAGVGKSCLLDATLQHAEHSGFATVAISGTRALADIPLAAFAAMLPHRLAGDAGDLVQIRRLLQERAGGRPLLLGVDDAQLLDDASAAVTYQLATDLTAFVVATARTGEVPPDAITALHKDGLAARVSLDPFGREDLDEFARATLLGTVAAELTDQLWTRTLGNPLFARELLLQARDVGSIVVRDGAWHLAGEFVAPDSLGDLIEARLAGLSERHQRAAALVAVGGPLEIELLERLVDPDVLVELEAARVVAADEIDDRLVVRFVHPVYADATRRRVGRLTARSMLRELAATLDATPKQRPEDILRIATWRLDAGADADPHLLLQAARLATRRNDFPLAERLATHAFEEQPSLAAAATIAMALVEQGRYGDAATILHDERVDRVAAPLTDRHRAAMAEVSVEFWGLGSLQAANAVLDRVSLEHPELADLVASTRASMYAAAGRPLEAMAFAPLGSPAAQTPFGITTILLSLAAAGTPDTALTAVGAIPDAARASAAAVVHVAHGFALTEAGRVEEALLIGVEGWERAIREGDRHGRVAWAIANGWAELNYGRRAAAKRWFDEAADLARDSAAAVHGVRWALGGSLLASALAGDAVGAQDALRRLDEMPPHDAVAHSHMEHSGRAWMLAASDGPQAAIGRARAPGGRRAATRQHRTTSAPRDGHRSARAAGSCSGAARGRSDGGGRRVPPGARASDPGARRHRRGSDGRGRRRAAGRRLPCARGGSGHTGVGAGTGHDHRHPCGGTVRTSRPRTARGDRGLRNTGAHHLHPSRDQPQPSRARDRNTGRRGSYQPRGRRRADHRCSYRREPPRPHLREARRALASRAVAGAGPDRGTCVSRFDAHRPGDPV